MTKTMSERLNPEAQKRLEQYLRQMRAALKGCPSVNADEVERDIREHIDNALPEEQDSLSLQDLDAVLDRLGKPTQWVPQQELSPWRRFIVRVRNGPEDWRLAYLAFGLLVFGVVLWPLFWVLIPASYLVARAGLEAARGRNEELGAQRWFIYPPLFVVNTFLLMLVLCGLPVLGGGLVLQLDHFLSGGHMAPPDVVFRGYEVPQIFAAMAAALGLWWIIVGIIVYVWPASFRTLLGSYAINSKYAIFLTCAGLLMGTASALVWLRL